MANDEMSATVKGGTVDEDLIEQAYEALDGNPVATDTRNQSKWQKWKENFKRKGWILLFIIPALIYIIIFCYVPMYGILVAFQDYMPGDQIIGSGTVWVGWDNFHTFFSNPNFYLEAGLVVALDHHGGLGVHDGGAGQAALDGLKHQLGIHACLLGFFSLSTLLK